MNNCYTYFTITGDFNTDEITQLLGITPEESWSKGDVMKNGKRVYDFSRWSCGFCRDYDVYTVNQIKKTIAPLKDKTEILRQIKERYNASLFIEVVVKIEQNESTPCFGTDLEIIDFCHKSRAEIDVDLYVYEKD